MQFIVKRDILLKSLSFVQGVVEKKNTLPILSNVLLQLKDNKLSIRQLEEHHLYQWNSFLKSSRNYWPKKT